MSLTDSSHAYLQQLLGLEIAKTQYTLIAEEPFTVSHDLSTTLRGALGWAMSEVGCLNECPRARSQSISQPTLHRNHNYVERDCAVQGCPYSKAFLGNDWNKQGLRVFPQSYRISGPSTTEPRTYLRGDSLRFELTLFGVGARYSPFWTLSTIKAAARGLGGKRSGFFLTEALDLLNAQVLYERSSGLPPIASSVVSLKNLISSPPADWFERCALRLELKTPLLLREVPDEPPLSLFVFAIMRRLHALYARFQFPIQHLLSAQELIELSQAQVHSDLSWRSQHRLSSTSGGKVPQSGRVGTLTYTQLAHSLWCYELLSAGTFIGVGQQTNMGLGRYEIKLL